MRQPDRHATHFDGTHCQLALEHYANGTMVVRIAGSDVGEFGEAPLVELSAWLKDSESGHLFIDARAARGASIDVSSDWARWLNDQKGRLGSITMLAASPFVQVTADFVRRFSELEGVMKVCTEPEIFDEALGEAVRKT